MNYDFFTMICQDLKTRVSKQYLSRICQLYESIDPNNYKDSVALVVLLHEITEMVSYPFPSIHERMCAHRGVNHKTAFSTKKQMISYTSAEYAKEQYNISDKVYQEILRFNDESYNSETKSEVMLILEKLE